MRISADVLVGCEGLCGYESFNKATYSRTDGKQHFGSLVKYVKMSGGKLIPEERVNITDRNWARLVWTVQQATSFCQAWKSA